MTRLLTKHLTITDHCTRCPLDRPTVPPTDLGSDPDGRNVVLIYTCNLGHAWSRTLTRAALKGAPTKATAGRRRHLADRTPVTTTTTTTADNDCTDVAHLTRAARQPGPRTTWHPTRRLWEPR